MWLGDVISVRDLTVTADDTRLTIDLAYVVTATGAAQTATFTRPVV
jgi:hypothetical protein